jgi:hypothetical protein
MNNKKDHSHMETEVETQKLNKLDHYRGSFELSAGRKMDAEYFEKFTALVKTWVDHEVAGIKELAIKLEEAGKQNNADAVRENISALCEKLREQITGKAAEVKPVGEILIRIKDALLTGEDQKAEDILNELSDTPLNPPDRQLYLRLYECMLIGETEKAISMIGDYHDKNTCS